MNHFTFFAALLVLGVGCASTPKPLPTSIPPLKALAEKGDAEAQFQLAHKYYLGKGVEKDYKKAVIWYRKAAEQNFPQAQFTLGYQYILGQGVKQDEKEAVKWFRKAAEQNNAGAQTYLGAMYFNGKGVEKDDKEAVKWFRKAAEQGAADAQSCLGSMYASGQGVAKDEKQAVKWFRKAAEHNDPQAQAKLGFMHMVGRGVKKDGKEATKWYRKAADQGNESAKDILKRIPEHVISEQMLISEQLPKRIGYTHLAWNLAYNFSSEEKDTNERWKWVNAGISLLRDEAIPKYPDEPELYWELAWTFMHKMGQGSDAAHRNYKSIWINQMSEILWPSLEDCMKNGGRPNFKELIDPPKDDSRKSKTIRARVRRLTNKFKMDPRKMQQIDRELGTMMVPDENGEMQEKYVGLEWRLPETHSIYWSWVGYKKCQHNIPRLDLVRKLRRLMFQSMTINFQRGRLMVDRYVPDWEERYKDGRNWTLYPRLKSVEIVENIFQKQLEWIEAVLANQKQESKELTKRIKELEREVDELAPKPKEVTDATLETFRNAHHNFYRKAVTDLYMHNQMNEAHYYFKLLCQGYPEKMKFYIGYDVKTMDLDTFVTNRIVQNMKSGGRAQTMAILGNYISRAYGFFSMDEDEQAKGFMRLARRAYERYNRRKAGTEEDRVLLSPFDQIHNKGLNNALKFFGQKHPLKATNLRQRLGLKDGEEAKFNALPDAINPFKKNKPNKK